jgi:hypothetical protein
MAVNIAALYVGLGPMRFAYGNEFTWRLNACGFGGLSLLPPGKQAHNLLLAFGKHGSRAEDRNQVA